MASQDWYLEFHIEKLLGGAAGPVDLHEIGSRIGATVHELEMIPEAAMQVMGNQFHIFLQSNFKDRPGAGVRQRFSFAHEIAHTLFYELRNGELKSRKDAPTGERLERACHKGASMLLVPTKLLNERIAGREKMDASSIMELAAQFDVSVEVMVRRLHDVGAFEGGDFAPVLTRRAGGQFVIEYTAYPPWLMCHLPTPKRGGDFMAWFRPANESGGTLTRSFPDGTLTARPVDASNSSRIFEISFESNSV